MLEKSDIARRLKAIRKLSGLTVRAVAKKLDIPASTYSTYEDSYKKPVLPVPLVKQLVVIFKDRGIPEDQVWALAGISTTLGPAPVAEPIRNIPVDKPDQTVASPNKGNVTYLHERIPSGVRDLPIRGHSKAGKEGFFIDQGETWGFAMRPETLRGIPEAYAVRVHDDCMSPRYEPGEVLQVDPFRQTKPGDVVIVQLHDGQAFVKFLVRRSGGLVVCRQLNPAVEIDFQAAKVKSIHLVVGVDYLER